jgi:hypothetical protein
VNTKKIPCGGLAAVPSKPTRAEKLAVDDMSSFLLSVLDAESFSNLERYRRIV